FFDSIVYRSADGGRTWQIALEIPVGTASFVEGQGRLGAYTMDPDCAYGVDGSALVTVISEGYASHAQTLAYRSPDGGLTWSTPVHIPGHLDREFITVDNSEGKYRGRIYVNAIGVGQFLDDPQAVSQPNPTTSIRTDSQLPFETALNIFRSLDQGVTF